MINKKSGKAIYLQIAESIIKMINEQDLEIDSIIPSENMLAETYKVSRLTARRAVDYLVNQGFLYRIKGKGTFVAERNKIEYVPQKLQGFTEEIISLNMTPRNEIVKFEVIKAGKIAKKLQIAEDDMIYHVIRVRYADDEALILERSYIPIDIFPELNISVMKGSKYEYVEKYTGKKVIESFQEIEAHLPNEEEIEYLKVEEPLLKISNLSFLEGRKIFEYSISYFRTSKYKFVQRAVRST